MRADDEAVEFRGPIGSMFRPLSETEMRRTMRFLFLMFATAVLSTVPLILGWVEVKEVNTTNIAVAAYGSAAYLVFLGYVLRSPRDRLIRLMPATTLMAFISAVAGISVSIASAGPRFGVVAVYFVEAPLVSFYTLRFGWAMTWTAALMTAYAIALAFVKGAPVPANQWIIVLSSAVLSGVLIGGLASRLDNTQQQLASINTKLRRFLAPQVADALASEDDRLAPHRRAIAAFFVDLRGFTAFTNSAEPDRVVGVLAEYYAAVGTIVDDYGGTLGGFDGDGVFAFFGDPVPNDSAATDALATAKMVANRLDDLVLAWSTARAELGYGIGLAFGEATVGLVGFEGRLDYTPVGVCVNLASRLCGDAKSGEIVVDDAMRTAAELDDASVTRRTDVDLKGFGVTSTYSVSH